METLLGIFKKLLDHKSLNFFPPPVWQMSPRNLGKNTHKTENTHKKELLWIFSSSNSNHAYQFPPPPRYHSHDVGLCRQGFLLGYLQCHGGSRRGCLQRNGRHQGEGRLLRKHGCQQMFHKNAAGNDTCFAIGDPADGLIPFSGCVGDHKVGYGEDCSGAGKAPFVAANATECGCQFQIEGDGCYKANDLPGQQWFVYLDGESCHDHGSHDDSDDGKSGARTLAAATLGCWIVSLAAGVLWA